ncbi:MAG: hypothetical protein KAH35_02935, partial [Candidatus Atribacteria bacterium]|nr:hypothetical protein [Candidatus Atribacteria bacterium]
EDFQKALRLRYEMMGWDVNTGIPTEAKLTELGLDWLVSEIKKLPQYPGDQFLPW